VSPVASTLVAAALLLLIVAAFGFVIRSVQTADRVLLLVAVVSVAIMLVPDTIYPHYVYFPAAFISMSLAVLVSATMDRIRPRTSPMRTLVGPVSVTLGCLVIAALLLPQQGGYARSHLKTAFNPKALGLVISPKSCVVTDESSILIAADLFNPSTSSCPSVVDAFGTWLADGPKGQPAYTGLFPADFVNEWARWLNQADYLVETTNFSNVIPWTAALRAWFKADFKPAYGSPNFVVWMRIRRTEPPMAVSPVPSVEK
jgi:hypothetical protein